MSCDKQLGFFDEELLKRENWAIRRKATQYLSGALYFTDKNSHQFPVFDNWSKLQSGLLQGNVRNYGIFTECVRFRHNSSSPEVGSIAGQHCIVNIQSTFDGVWNKGGDFSWADM